jgi:hypothetical protein
MGAQDAACKRRFEIADDPTFSHRTLGGIMAGVLFIIPGVVSIMGLGMICAALESSTLLPRFSSGLCSPRS